MGKVDGQNQINPIKREGTVFNDGMRIIHDYYVIGPGTINTINYNDPAMRQGSSAYITSMSLEQIP